MILTGEAIRVARNAGDITIEPFSDKQLNPNSYNYRLGPIIGVPHLNSEQKIEFTQIQIPENGLLIEPGTMYLGHTLEILGSQKYAMSLIGRSSIGRLGLFLQVSANLGHTGSCHQWTLELVSAKTFRLYEGMKIGQISFWTNSGPIDPYVDGYTMYNDPHASIMAN